MHLYEASTRYPAPFQAGHDAAQRYYARVDSGEIREGEGYEPIPYVEHTPEWRAYNAGWFSGMPNDEAVP